MIFDKIGLAVPVVLLPKKGIDMKKWAVVACDQHTSEPEYWEKVKESVGDAPSTFKLMLPEAYLESEKKDEMIREINRNMHDYLRSGILAEQKKGFVLVDRKTSRAGSRKGLVVALDLESYDYNKGSQTLIRATEGTIVERLPPRIKIREAAAVELPHIMVLIDDPKKRVIEPLFRKKHRKVYDFSLMMKSGHVKGYLVSEHRLIAEVASRLSELADPENFSRRYNAKGKGVLLFAVGDGNHSLATAKALWERMKSGAKDKEKIMGHPARFALVELVNVHDKGLEFEPIHRVLFNADAERLLKGMKDFFTGQGCEFSAINLRTEAEMKKAARSARKNGKGSHTIGFVSEQGYGIITVMDPKLSLEVATLQSFLDGYLKDNAGIKIDYIHGEKAVRELGKKQGSMGFFLPAMPKHSLFSTVINDGALPRKTFSMGEADEKRFYLECRKIVE